MSPQAIEMTEPILQSPLLPTDDMNIELSKHHRFHMHRIKDRLLIELEIWERKSPMLKKLTNQARRVPPWLRVAFVLWWVLWKFIWLFVAIRLLWWSASSSSSGSSTSSQTISTSAAAAPHHHQDIALPAFGPDDVEIPTKVLYIVTSLAEFDSGHRATVRGRDRFQELMVPCIVDSIKSMVSHPYNFDVDLYLITAYTLKPERIQYLRDLLPHGVGLEVWDDACPIGYDKRAHAATIVGENTRSLARQHRYVIKDKLHHYDMFVPFEDDMRITGAHVQHYLEMSMELDRLTHEAPDTMSDVPESQDPMKMKFFGQMTRNQMKRLVPGLIRVEVLVNETVNGAQTKLAPIELDFIVDGVEQHIDPSICCHIPNLRPNVNTPVHPTASQVIIWETRPEAFSVRHVSGSKLFDWTLLMLGPGKRQDPAERVMGYWSGRDGAFGDMVKPTGAAPDLIAQQGGWIATREQLIRMDEELCMGSFLPPFDEPTYFLDGQQSMNVEFW